jgi:hypothetical protein
MVMTWVILSRPPSLLEQRASFLEMHGEFNHTLLQLAFDDLKKEVVYLADRPITKQAAVAYEQDAMSEELRHNLEQLFDGSLAREAAFLQLRYLANDDLGSEKIRLHRDGAGGVSVQTPDGLKSQRGLSIFDWSTRIGPGKVFLSQFSVHREYGRRQWQTPVIAASSPVMTPDGTGLSGVIALDMHMGRLGEAMNLAATDALHVFLADDEGRFLYFPGSPDIPLCFERQLEFPLESLFDELSGFRIRDQSTAGNLDTSCRASLLVTAVTAETDEVALHNELKRVPAHLRNGFDVQLTAYDQADRLADHSDTRAMALFVGDGSGDAAGLLEALKIQLGAQYQCQQIPVFAGSSQRQAFHCRKLFFDDENPDRFLCLLLVLPIQ